MTWLVVQGGDRSIGASQGHLEVKVRGTLVQRLSLDRLDVLLLEGPVQVSAAARRLLLRGGVETTFLNGRGEMLGRLVGSEARGGVIRLAQARTALDLTRRLQIAASFVAGKIHNQYVALRRAHRFTPTEAGADALATLRALRDRAPSATTLPELMGIEGFAARTWFSFFPLALRNPDFAWTGRNRRPPRDPVNAALSFLYTVLCSATDAAARRAGLDPAFGLLHETGRGKPACALDLAEEWRPLVDGTVLGLINRRQLGPGDFCNPEIRPDPVGEPFDEDPLVANATEETAADPHPAVHLSASGRRIVLAAWNQRLRGRVRYPPLDARFELQEVIRLQARQLAAAVQAEVPTYVPWRHA